MSSLLPKSIQDIEAKERFGLNQQRDKNKNPFGIRFPFRGRVIIYIGFIMFIMVLLMIHFGDVSRMPSFSIQNSLNNNNNDIEHQEAAIVAAMMDNDIPSLPQPLGEQSLESEIKSILRAHPLTVFSKTYCPYSRKAKEILNEYPLKIPFYVVEVDLRDDAMEIKKLLGEHTQLDTFPNIFINGGSIGGATELSRLDKSGRLEEILKENNLL
ncbi:hypothetical protein INT45_013308 [Circinella minor]|uniref:Glutaredoxin domain-containing protein n=1 Tax=Circinella minor TaxID=1195481 RepID=A0A8H7VK34_9FUNG|nr:hypothetical protein INT45_013308 [Circinella minor]